MTPLREVCDVVGDDVRGHNQEEMWWRLAEEDSGAGYIHSYTVTEGRAHSRGVSVSGPGHFPYFFLQVVFKMYF